MVSIIFSPNIDLSRMLKKKLQGSNKPKKELVKIFKILLDKFLDMLNSKSICFKGISVLKISTFAAKLIHF
jgi:hypothetical protein